MLRSTKDAPRTMWQAARDIFEAANRNLDAAMWERAYRLWVMASATRAPGTPWMLTEYRPYWLPTDLSNPTPAHRLCDVAVANVRAAAQSA